MRKLVAAAVLAVSLVLGATAAQADTCITFQDTRLGQIEFASFDWKVGNALSKGAIDANNSATLYYQASIVGLLDANGDAIAGTGLGLDYELTIIANFGQTLVGVGTQNLSFGLDSAAASSFSIYYDTLGDATGVKSNDLNGVGFNDGTKILTGTIGTASGSFILSGTAPRFDAFGNNDFPGVSTVTGLGASEFTGVVDTAATVTSLIDGCSDLTIVLLNATGSQVTPFTTTNPSKKFVDALGNIITPDIGLVNGQSGPDFQFKTDGSNDFTVVPVPGAVWLLGTGLLGLLGLRRRVNG